MDKLDDGFLKFMIGMKMAQIVHFALEDSPEAFHGPIVDTSTNTRHSLKQLLFSTYTLYFSHLFLSHVISSSVDENLYIALLILRNPVVDLVVRYFVFLQQLRMFPILSDEAAENLD